MPLILTQHASRDLNRYLDREWLIYHFPAQYLREVRRAIEGDGDRRFLYQRPIRGATREEAGTYFGYGTLSDPYPDESTPNHYWMNVLEPRPLRPVPLRDPLGLYYETGRAEPINLRGRSIRYIDPMRYFSIIAAGHGYSAIPAATDVQETGIFAPSDIPRDPFREMLVVPPGTGYVPSGGHVIDPYEAAALHERARGDHQAMVALLKQKVTDAGGVCLYNNNVDLLAKIGGRRMLIEVKSLTQQTAAVNRMRYGIGQLMDYRVRYRADVAEATPVLAFGAELGRDVNWIPTILEDNGIAFLARRGDQVIVGNDRAKGLPIFGDSSS